MENKFLDKMWENAEVAKDSRIVVIFLILFAKFMIYTLTTIPFFESDFANAYARPAVCYRDNKSALFFQEKLKSTKMPNFDVLSISSDDLSGMKKYKDFKICEYEEFKPKETFLFLFSILVAANLICLLIIRLYGGSITKRKDWFDFFIFDFIMIVYFIISVN